MPHFEKNLAALAARYPDITWKNILTPLKDQMPLGIRLEQSRSGAPTLMTETGAVHSQYDPQKEAEKIVQSLQSDVDGYIIIGPGLGYLARALHHQYPHKQMILIEPEIPLFILLLRSFDMSDLISSSNVHFFFSSYRDDLLQLLRRLNMYSLQTIPNRALSLRHPEYYEAMQKEARLYILRRSVNFKTIQEQGQLWLHNLCCNMNHFAQTPGVSHLTNSMQGLPALLIVAGPSLDTLWPYIQEIRKRCVLVCVDTALRILLQHDIQPDFIIAVDSQYWNSRHLDNCSSSSSIFVADPSLYPSILRNKEGFHFFLTSSLFPMGEYIEERVEKKGEILSGGSVSTSAFDLCRKIGASSIWAIGLDLAFPSGSTHAHGARFEEWALCDGMRLAPAQNFFLQQSFTAFPSYYQANHGGMVMTDKRMEVYRLWFEDQAQSIPCWNLSQGVKIQHMQAASWPDILALPPVRDEIDKKMQALYHIGTDTQTLEEKLSAAIKEMQHELLRVKRICNEAEIETKKLISLMKNNKDIKQCVQKLDKLDQGLAQSHSKEFLAFLLEPFFQKFQHSQREEKDPIGGLLQSCRLYSQLSQSTDYYQNLLKIWESLRPRPK